MPNRDDFDEDEDPFGLRRADLLEQRLRREEGSLRT